MIRVPLGSVVLLATAAISSQDPPAAPQTKATAPPSHATSFRPEAERRLLSETVSGLRGVLDAIRGKPGELESRPIKVNGEVLPASVVVRELVYRTAARAIPHKVTELLLLEHAEERIRDGAKAESFEVSEEEVDEKVREAKSQFESANAGRRFEDQLRSGRSSLPEFRAQARNQKLLDQVFFPGPPRDWPDFTVEAITAAGGEQGGEFWAKLRDSVAGPVPPFWLAICRSWVTKELAKRSRVQFASDGIPKDAVVIVNGRPWTTEDARRAVFPALAPEEIDRAVVDLVVGTALRQELLSKGVWPSDESFRKEFRAYAEPLDATPFTTEVIALTFKGYPSMEVYKQRWRLLQAYEKSIAQEIDAKALRAHAAKTGIVADRKLDAQYIRVPAFDDAAGAWREDGWAKARAEAAAAMDAIGKGMAFEKAAREYGKYRSDDQEKGFPGSIAWNDLRKRFGESEYLDLVHGFSVARVLLEDAEEGQVIGPLPGSDGYVIAKLVSRSDPAAVDLAEPKVRNLVKDDYVTTRFLAWARGVVARTTVE